MNMLLVVTLTTFTLIGHTSELFSQKMETLRQELIDWPYQSLDYTEKDNTYEFYFRDIPLSEKSLCIKKYMIGKMFDSGDYLYRQSLYIEFLKEGRSHNGEITLEFNDVDYYDNFEPIYSYIKESTPAMYATFFAISVTSPVSVPLILGENALHNYKNEEYTNHLLKFSMHSLKVPRCNTQKTH